MGGGAKIVGSWLPGSKLSATLSHAFTKRPCTTLFAAGATGEVTNVIRCVRRCNVTLSPHSDDCQCHGYIEVSIGIFFSG